MFGFGKKPKKEEAGDIQEKVLDMWMELAVNGTSIGIWAVDPNEVKKDNRKLKIFLAFFFGTADTLCRNANLSQDIMMKIFLKCVAKHLEYTSKDEIENAHQTIHGISEDMDYVKIMRDGITNFKSCIINREEGAMPLLYLLIK